MQNKTLSRDDTTLVLDRLLLDRLPHKGQLFEPNTLFYDQFSDETKLAGLARELYRWLGAKPHHLQVHYNEHAATEDAVTLPTADQHLPYRAAARLSLAVVRQILEQRSGETVSAELCELATIEAGLGVVVLNGLTDQPQLLHRWYDGLNSRARHDIHLQTYTPVSYALAVGDYAHRYHLSGQAVMQQLSDNAQRAMPAYYRQLEASPRRLPCQLADLRRSSRRLMIKMVGVGLLSGMVVSMGCYVYAQRPYQPSQAVIDQYETLALLEKSYNICTQTVQQERNQADLNDIFSDQRINAHLVRCESLRNQYNYHVGLYNAMIEGQQTTISAK